jgi:hypothetical protein
MLIIGCDFHTRSQQIAMAREETAEMIVERRLDHGSGEAQASCRSLQSFEEAGPRGHRSDRPHSLVRALAHGAWPRNCGSEDPHFTSSLPANPAKPSCHACVIMPGRRLFRISARIPNNNPYTATTMADLQPW